MDAGGEITAFEAPVVVSRPRDLERLWAAEQHDPDWTLNARTFINAIFDTLGFSMAPSFIVDCRETICQALFDEVNSSTMIALGTETSKMGVPSTFGRDRIDGGMRWKVYFAREGHEDETFEFAQEGARSF